MEHNFHFDNMWTSYLFVLPVLLGCTEAVELTFELPDSAKECFFEVIEEGTESTVEFQVSLAERRKIDDVYFKLFLPI